MATGSERVALHRVAIDSGAATVQETGANGQRLAFHGTHALRDFSGGGSVVAAGTLYAVDQETRPFRDTGVVDVLSSTLVRCSLQSGACSRSPLALAAPQTADFIGVLDESLIVIGQEAGMNWEGLRARCDTDMAQCVGSRVSRCALDGASCRSQDYVADGTGFGARAFDARRRETFHVWGWGGERATVGAASVDRVRGPDDDADAFALFAIPAGGRGSTRGVFFAEASRWLGVDLTTVLLSCDVDTRRCASAPLPSPAVDVETAVTSATAAGDRLVIVIEAADHRARWTTCRRNGRDCSASTELLLPGREGSGLGHLEIALAPLDGDDIAVFAAEGESKEDPCEWVGACSSRPGVPCALKPVVHSTVP